MNRLVGIVMVGLIAAIVVEIARDDVPSWLAWTSLVLAAVAILTALAHTVPSAVPPGSA